VKIKKYYFFIILNYFRGKRNQVDTMMLDKYNVSGRGVGSLSIAKIFLQFTLYWLYCTWNGKKENRKTNQLPMK
jgi:hypothetical protein